MAIFFDFLLATFICLIETQRATMKKERQTTRGNRHNDRIPEGAQRVTVIANSPITLAWASVATMQDYIIRKMNEMSMIEIAPEKILFWQKKFHEALVMIDQLNESASIDLGLNNIYKRSALVSVIKSNFETEKLAKELRQIDDNEDKEYKG
jgi:Zn-dependent M32 family carboxypeptidase